MELPNINIFGFNGEAIRTEDGKEWACADALARILESFQGAESKFKVLSLGQKLVQNTGDKFVLTAEEVVIIKKAIKTQSSFSDMVVAQLEEWTKGL